jgi:internalin A
MRLRALMLVVLVGSLIAADDPKDVAKKELESLQGDWIVASAEQNGKPDETRKDAQVTIAGNQFTRATKSLTVKGTLQLDPSKNPKALDLTYADGPDKGTMLQGIYKLEKDTWTMCLAARPTEFSSKPSTGQLLIVLKRKPIVVQIFSDKNLEAAVRAVLHEPKGELNDTNLMNVYVLEASSKEIRNLAGLEKCKNLALIKFSKNHVSDLAPLKDLANLQSLDLADNQIKDVTPLAGLTKLQYLELSNNQISKVDSLSGLSNLSALYLSGNQISSIEPLGKLSRLASLSLGHNQIRDLSALTQVTKLSTLDLKDNQIEDLNPLTKQTELSLLMLDRNKITDLGPLVSMAKADAEGAKRFAPYLRLYLSGNPLSETAKSSQLSALKGFGVRVEY